MSKSELFSEDVLYLVRRVRGHAIVAGHAYADRPARLLSELAKQQASTASVAPVLRDLGTLNSTSYGRIVGLLSNILTLDKKTDRIAVFLKQGWVSYKKGGYRVLRGTPIEYEHKDRRTAQPLSHGAPG